MKFFYAITLGILTFFLQLSVLLYVFPLPTLSTYIPVENESLKQALESARFDSYGTIYLIRQESEEIVQSKLFLISLVGLVQILVALFLWIKKTHILFPILFGIIVSIVFVFFVLALPSSLPISFYLDMQRIKRAIASSYAAIILSILLCIEIIIIRLGYWYTMP